LSSGAEIYRTVGRRQGRVRASGWRMVDDRPGLRRAFFVSFWGGPYLVGDFSPSPLLTPFTHPLSSVLGRVVGLSMDYPTWFITSQVQLFPSPSPTPQFGLRKKPAASRHSRPRPTGRVVRKGNNRGEISNRLR
jgi:hypothetical protein